MSPDALLINGLGAERRAAFDRDGFLVLENFISGADCQALIKRAGELVDAFDPSRIVTIFSSRQQTHSKDEYFQHSGDKIRFFFEPEAFDAAGRLKQPKALSINKIGHALHDLDPLFERFSRTRALAQLSNDLGVTRPLLLQSMYIFKQPGIGEEVSCHQDSTFLYTEPLSCIGFWFALQDATVANGCLWAIPGRHALRQRFRYRDGELAMETLDGTPLPVRDAVPLEVARGTLIVLDGRLPHYSGPNRSAVSRHAYTLHVIDSACRYPDDNWLRRGPTMPLRGFEQGTVAVGER